MQLGRVVAFLVSIVTAPWLALDAHTADAVRFGLPVACELGRTCMIQHYVDRDPSSGARDYACGTLTYDGHDGTDFRLLTMEAQRRGVAVVAAADGRVTRGRDDMPDISVGMLGTDAIEGRECGNGVIIEHADGWQTQYCHMALGSLKVRSGDAVKAGQVLGQIGLSGLTEFPHLHFMVRHQGKVVDPFSVGAAEGSCNGGTSLWAPSVQQAHTYRAGLVLNSGFASGLVTMESVESGEAGRVPPRSDSPALVAFVRAIGLRAGDVPRITVRSPDGALIVDNAAAPLDRNKAQHMLFAGKKRPEGGWPSGTYRAIYSVSRGGSVVIEQSFDVTL